MPSHGPDSRETSLSDQSNRRKRRDVMPRVVHFEISADDPERAVTFYNKVFGWQVRKWDGPEDYWLIQTGPDSQPGINGGLFRRRGPVGHVNTIDVPSIDEFSSRIQTNG